MEKKKFQQKLEEDFYQEEDRSKDPPQQSKRQTKLQQWKQQKKKSNQNVKPKNKEQHQLINTAKNMQQQYKRKDNGTNPNFNLIAPQKNLPDFSKSQEYKKNLQEEKKKQQQKQSIQDQPQQKRKNALDDDQESDFRSIFKYEISKENFNEHTLQTHGSRGFFDTDFQHVRKIGNIFGERILEYAKGANPDTIKKGMRIMFGLATAQNILNTSDVKFRYALPAFKRLLDTEFKMPPTMIAFARLFGTFTSEMGKFQPKYFKSTIISAMTGGNSDYNILVADEARDRSEMLTERYISQNPLVVHGFTVERFNPKFITDGKEKKLTLDSFPAQVRPLIEEQWGKDIETNTDQIIGKDFVVRKLGVNAASSLVNQYLDEYYEFVEEYQFMIEKFFPSQQGSAVQLANVEKGQVTSPFMLPSNEVTLASMLKIKSWVVASKEFKGMLPLTIYSQMNQALFRDYAYSAKY